MQTCGDIMTGLGISYSTQPSIMANRMSNSEMSYHELTFDLNQRTSVEYSAGVLVADPGLPNCLI